MLDRVGWQPRPEPAASWRPWFRMPQLVRDLKGLPPVLARAGSLELRLATTKKDIRKAQRLRYRVFYHDGHAVSDLAKASIQRDKCPFDRACDHLLVIDTAALGRRGRPKAKVVGTYRLLRDDMAADHFGYYSESEFELAPLLHRHRGTRFLELGRSCVHPEFRSKRVIDLLWQGIVIYAAHHGLEVLFGCSSLRGTDARSLAEPLSYAYHHAAAPSAWQVAAVPSRAVRMDWLAPDAFDARRALFTLPAVMKAYVRAGGTFASEAAVDHAFGTLDLFTLLPLAAATPRYLAQFSNARRREA